VVGNAGAAYAADVGDQRDLLVVGALLAVGVALATNDQGPLWARALGFVALIFASVNIFGGFLVTQRMLAMYQKKKK
jgi:NAD(P) transhydrogenase subunit alpha